MEQKFIPANKEEWIYYITDFKIPEALRIDAFMTYKQEFVTSETEKTELWFRLKDRFYKPNLSDSTPNPRDDLFNRPFQDYKNTGDFEQLGKDLKFYQDEIQRTLNWIKVPINDEGFVNPDFAQGVQDSITRFRYDKDYDNFWKSIERDSSVLKAKLDEVTFADKTPEELWNERVMPKFNDSYIPKQPREPVPESETDSWATKIRKSIKYKKNEILENLNKKPPAEPEIKITQTKKRTFTETLDDFEKSFKAQQLKLKNQGYDWGEPNKPLEPKDFEMQPRPNYLAEFNARNQSEAWARNWTQQVKVLEAEKAESFKDAIARRLLGSKGRNTGGQVAEDFKFSDTYDIASKSARDFSAVYKRFFGAPKSATTTDVFNPKGSTVGDDLLPYSRGNENNLWRRPVVSTEDEEIVIIKGGVRGEVPVDEPADPKLGEISEGGVEVLDVANWITLGAIAAVDLCNQATHVTWTTDSSGVKHIQKNSTFCSDLIYDKLHLDQWASANQKVDEQQAKFIDQIAPWLPGWAYEQLGLKKPEENIVEHPKYIVDPAIVGGNFAGIHPIEPGDGPKWLDDANEEAIKNDPNNKFMNLQPTKSKPLTLISPLLPIQKPGLIPLSPPQQNYNYLIYSLGVIVVLYLVYKIR